MRLGGGLGQEGPKPVTAFFWCEGSEFGVPGAKRGLGEREG